MSTNSSGLLLMPSNTLADAWEQVLQSKSGLNFMMGTTSSSHDTVRRNAGGSYSCSLPSRSIQATSQTSQLLIGLQTATATGVLEDESREVLNLHWPASSAAQQNMGEVPLGAFGPPPGMGDLVGEAGGLMPSRARNHMESFLERTEGERLKLAQVLDGMHKHGELFDGRFRVLRPRQRCHGPKSLIQVRNM
jgi:hypothetical protein